MNAFDYLYKEWNYKPAGFVSYGGISGGMRSVQMSKLILTAMKVMPIPEAVAIPFFPNHMKERRVRGPGRRQRKRATAMLDELHRWAEALKPHARVRWPDQAALGIDRASSLLSKSDL